MCDVGIVMVIYNSASKLGKFFNKVLESLMSLDVEGLNVKIVIVDNASRDNTVNLVRDFLNSKGINAEIVNMKRNTGLPAGYNYGAVKAKDCRYLMFLNDDVILSKDTLKALMKTFEGEIYGAVQPLIVHLDGYLEHGFDIGLSGAVLPTIKPLVKGINERAVIAGCCLMTPSTTFFRAGMFRGELFWGYDDADYCWRVHALGYKCAVTTETHVIHYGSATWGKENPLKLYLGLRNELTCLIKNSKASILPLQLLIRPITVMGLTIAKIKNKDYRELLYIIRAMRDSVSTARKIPPSIVRRIPPFTVLVDASFIPSVNRFVNRLFKIARY